MPASTTPSPRPDRPTSRPLPLPVCHPAEAIVLAFDIGFSYVYCPACDRSVWRAPDGRRAQTPEELLRASWKARRRRNPDAPA
jgi:hypothetical protein